MNLSLKNYYIKWSKNLLLLFLINLFILSFCRIVFAFYFGDWNILLLHKEQVLSAFFLGLRFDLMPLAYIFFVPFVSLNLGCFFDGKRTIKIVRRIILFFISAGLFTLFWIYVCDYGFFSFFQDHINILFYGLLEDDTKAVLISIWKNYNIFLWLFFFCVFFFLCFKFLFFLLSPFEFELKPRVRKPVICLILFFEILVLAFFARGNFSRLPLSIEDAHLSSVDFINKISINGPISLNRTIKIRKTFGKDNFNYLKKYKFSSIDQAYEMVFQKKYNSKLSLSLQLKKTTPSNDFLKQNPPHVVVVVMESHGTFWSDLDNKNFNLYGSLKKHLKEDFYFTNFLPAENGTIGSVVSVATSQVIRPGARFLSESEFLKTPLQSSGHLAYRKNGYDTHFVYGGKLGWRDLGKYLKVQGYDEVWGADEIKEFLPELQNLSDEELGNEWGIYDEYLYSFIEDRLKSARKPQFFFVLTTSNHPPFEFSPHYQPLSLELSLDFLNGLTVREDLARKRLLGFQYANQKMGEFLDRIKSGPLREKTVVSFTGDHSFWIAKGVDWDKEFRRYAVPFYIFLPNTLRPSNFDSKKFGSHEDIFPTLYNLTLSGQDYISLGENIFSEKSSAMNSSGLVANEMGAFHHGKFWKWTDDNFKNLAPVQSNPELESLKRYQEALITLTDLYLKEEKKRSNSDVKNDRQ